jgi:hypothetical protein
MIDLQNYANGENDSGAPSVTIRFDETKHSTEWTSVQYMVDFLSASGFSAATTAAIQSVIDANTP